MKSISLYSVHLITLSAFLFVMPVFALTIVPKFTAGPCPVVSETAITDGAVCPNGSPTDANGVPQCPVYYSPSIMPKGYNSVTYCDFIGNTVLQSGHNFYTKQFSQAQQTSFGLAAAELGKYVKDNITLTFEVYLVGQVAAVGPSSVVALATEFFTPICPGVDDFLPPLSNSPANIVKNMDGTFSYGNIAPTFDPVVSALKAKNAANGKAGYYKVPLTDYLPTRNAIAEEWSSEFLGQVTDSMYNAWNLNDFFQDQTTKTPLSAGTKPFAICGSPANMKILGLYKKAYDIANSPGNNVYATTTVDGTANGASVDGVYVQGDFPDSINDPAVRNLPYSQSFSQSRYFPLITDNATITGRQLPKAWYLRHNLQAVYYDSCDVGPNGKYLSDQISPTTGQPLPWCSYPKGFNWGINMLGNVKHELQHLMGEMWSEYYKKPAEGNAWAYAMENSHFVGDLFILDAQPASTRVTDGITSSNLSAYTAWPRKMESLTPAQHGTITSESVLEDWVQWSKHDNVFAFLDGSGKLQAVPLMNYTAFNPDLDIARETFRFRPPCKGVVDTQRAACTTTNGDQSIAINDPKLIALGENDEIHPNVMSNATRGVIDYSDERELNIMAALGYAVDFRYLKNNVYKKADTAAWYDFCFQKGSGGEGLQNGTGAQPIAFDQFLDQKPGCKYDIDWALTHCKYSAGVAACK